MHLCFILLIAALPPVFSLRLIPQVRRRWQERLAQIRAKHFDPPASSFAITTVTVASEQSALLGDLSCQFNARSPWLRCAVNPSGPCENCRHYQARGSQLARF
ncbi:MAG: DUF6464 family protein [Cyanobacteria bacterium P01_H01_bin.15]